MGFPIDDVQRFKKRIMHLAERFSEEVPDTPTDTPDAGRASSHFGSVSVPSDSVLANGEIQAWRVGYLEVMVVFIAANCDLFAVLGRLVEIGWLWNMCQLMDCGWHLDSSWPRTLRTARLSRSGFGCRDPLSAPQGTLHCFEGRPGLGGRPDPHESRETWPISVGYMRGAAQIFLDIKLYRFISSWFIEK